MFKKRLRPFFCCKHSHKNDFDDDKTQKHGKKMQETVSLFAILRYNHYQVIADELSE